MGRVWFVVLLCIVAAGTAGGEELPGADPVSRTVAALEGTWRGTMTAIVPDEEAETFAWTMRCEPVALGRGLGCTSSGTPSIGRLEESLRTETARVVDVIVTSLWSRSFCPYVKASGQHYCEGRHTPEARGARCGNWTPTAGGVAVQYNSFR